MTEQQKEILQAQLNSEKRTLKELEQVYKQALKDVEKKIAELSSRRDMENLQSIIYQKQYQEALKAQLEGVIAQLQSGEYATISDYLQRCYEDGYLGVMYDLQAQGIPIISPIDQSQVTQAIQTDTKLSKGLYARLGEDISKLKTSIRAEISRGIASGMMYNEIAEKIAKSFKNTPFNTAYNNAMRIARTEGHRIQITAADHAQHKAKEKGANIVKQWDATLDSRTRDSHMRVDGEIRELDEPFSNGLMYPGDPSGDAAEVVNCRCALLQRAKSALDESELETLKKRAEYYGLDKTKNFDDFKAKYLQASAPLLTHETAEIDYRSDKVTFKDLQQWRRSIGNVTEDEYAIISGMNEAGYIRNSNSYKINKAMREGKINELSDESKKTMETLREVINKNVSDRDAVLIRKVDTDYIENVFGVDTNNLQNTVDELNGKKLGETYLEKGFTSTSYKADKNLNKDSVEIEIYAPSGTKMFLTKNREESEIILQANTKFELEGATLTDDKTIRIIMKVVNQL